MQNQTGVITIQHKEFNIHFVLRMYFILEDRMPNIGENPSKYKVAFGIYLFGKQLFSYVGRSSTTGVLILKGKEL